MLDVDTEPLIALDRHGHDARDRFLDEDAVRAIDESALESPGLFIWGLTICAGVSGLLFGYEYVVALFTGVISSTLVSISTDLSNRTLTTLDKSLITSCTSFFALLASPLTGILADIYGRKTILLGADVLFILGALWQAWTDSVAGMIVGRSIVGAAVGSASFMVPLYIGELTPATLRGRLVVVNSLFTTGGQVVAYIIGWLFSSRQHGWRWMVGLGALPAAMQFSMLFLLPETPRHLVRTNQNSKAQEVLKKVYGNSSGAMTVVNEVMRGIEREVLEEDEAAGRRGISANTKQGWGARFGGLKDSLTQLIAVGGNRRALSIACMLQGFQQLCGFNSLMYFSATIFALVGFSAPTLTSLSIAATNFLLTLVAFAFIDRIGRRRILLWSVPVMIFGLVLCAIAFRFIKLPNGQFLLNMADPGGKDKIWAAVVLTAMVIYVAGYAVGMGNVPWQQSELFPLSVRSLGSALATATNWGSNTLIGITFLPMMDFFTPVWTFALYAAVCVAGWLTIERIYPETAGLGLEDVSGLLKDGFGVQDSVREFERRKRVNTSS